MKIITRLVNYALRRHMMAINPMPSMAIVAGSGTFCEPKTPELEVIVTPVGRSNWNDWV